jgi:hypothetical protein
LPLAVSIASYSITRSFFSFTGSICIYLETSPKKQEIRKRIRSEM